MKTTERSVEEIVSTFMSTWFRPAYFEAWTPANRQEQVLYDEAKLKWETCKNELTQTLQAERQRCDEMVGEAYNKGYNDKDREISELLMKDGVTYEELTQPNNK